MVMTGFVPALQNFSFVASACSSIAKLSKHGFGNVLTLQNFLFVASACSSIEKQHFWIETDDATEDQVRSDTRTMNVLDVIVIVVFSLLHFQNDYECKP